MLKLALEPVHLVSVRLYPLDTRRPHSVKSRAFVCMTYVTANYTTVRGANFM